MSDSKDTSDASIRGSWTDKIQGAVSSSSGVVQRAVNAVLGNSPDAASNKSDETATTSTTTTSPSHSSAADVGSSRTTSSDNPHPGSRDPQSSTENASSKTDSEPRSDGLTLAEKLSHDSSTGKSDPSPSSSATTEEDSSRLKPKTRSEPEPEPETREPESVSKGGDAPEADAGGDSTPSDQQDKKKDTNIGSSPDSELKPTQDSGPASTSDQQQSQPDHGPKPLSDTDDPLSKPADQEKEKQGGPNPIEEPPKSKEDQEDPGTGQEYVKSTGVLAQGGDFDAAKPGAGAEATRLLEQEGRHPASESKPGEPLQNNEEKKQKTSLKEKFQNVIHR